MENLIATLMEYFFSIAFFAQNKLFKNFKKKKKQVYYQSYQFITFKVSIM